MSNDILELVSYDPVKLKNAGCGRPISRILSDPTTTEVEAGRGSHFSVRPTHPVPQKRIERAALSHES